MSAEPIKDDEIVSRTRIMRAYRLTWPDVNRLLESAGVKPLPLNPTRKQPRYIGSAVRRALCEVCRK